LAPKERSIRHPSRSIEALPAPSLIDRRLLLSYRGSRFLGGPRRFDASHP
jgi:hypothetical protein